MPMNERRRLAIETRATIATTRRTAEELRKCVLRSETLLAESRLLLAQSSAAAVFPQIHRPEPRHDAVELPRDKPDQSAMGSG